MKRILLHLATAAALGLGAAAMAQPALSIRPLAERKVVDLPSGALFWRIETYPAKAAAEAAAGPWSLVAEAAGKVWLFTLASGHSSAGGSSASGASAGGTKVAEVGPIARPVAPQYLLRINEASGPKGSVTPVHRHPGSEAFYVLAGEQTIRGPHGTLVVKAGTPEAGHGAGIAMQVSSSGSGDLQSLVMFVVDATQPFSSPASLP